MLEFFCLGCDVRSWAYCSPARYLYSIYKTIVNAGFLEESQAFEECSVHVDEVYNIANPRSAVYECCLF